MDIGTKISLVAVSVTIIGLFATHFRTKSSADLRTDVELLKKQVALFWSIVEKEIGNMLHSPHRAELDRLIDANQVRKLNADELKQFIELLDRVEKEEPENKTAVFIYKAAVLARHAHVNH